MPSDDEKKNSFEKGEMLPPSATMDSVPAGAPVTPSSMCTDALSPRESGILQLIGQGKSNKEIASILGIAPETVKSHIKHIFIKLSVVRRAQAVSRAHSVGLLDSN